MLTRRSGRAISKPEMKELKQKSRVRKEETSALKEKEENALSGRRTDSVQDETPVVSTTGLSLVKDHNNPLLLQERRHRLTEESPTNMEVREEQVLQY